MAWKLFCDRCGEEATDLLYRLEVVGTVGRPWTEADNRKVIGPGDSPNVGGKVHRDFCMRCFDEVGLSLHRTLQAQAKPSEQVGA